MKAHKLSWTVNELCTHILRVPTSFAPIAHIHRWTLWKNHPSPVFNSKMQHKRQKNHTHTQVTSQRKYQVIISNYDFKHPIIYKIYQTSKYINQNMFCAKSRLLTPKTVLKPSLSHFFYYFRPLWSLETHRFTEIINFDTSWIIPISFKFLYMSLVNK